MKRFIAIEGLRGWLAWAVVFSHLTQTSGIYAKGFGPAPGNFAVLVFIMVSGFRAWIVASTPERKSNGDRLKRIDPERGGGASACLRESKNSVEDTHGRLHAA
jgi:peptidoglycan/LPS O-acetylase OafA/YrhL